MFVTMRVVTAPKIAPMAATAMAIFQFRREARTSSRSSLSRLSNSIAAGKETLGLYGKKKHDSPRSCMINARRSLGPLLCMGSPAHTFWAQPNLAGKMLDKNPVRASWSTGISHVSTWSSGGSPYNRIDCSSKKWQLKQHRSGIEEFCVSMT